MEEDATPKAMLSPLVWRLRVQGVTSCPELGTTVSGHPSRRGPHIIRRSLIRICIPVQPLRPPSFELVLSSRVLFLKCAPPINFLCVYIVFSHKALLRGLVTKDGGLVLESRT